MHIRIKVLNPKNNDVATWSTMWNIQNRSYLPFAFFEKIVPWIALVKIDVGQINHSEHFVRRLLDPCYKELMKRLQQHLNEPLPCTDVLRPINLMADKGTIKHDCNQITMIRTLALKNGCLFERFFLTHPEVRSHKGKDISHLLIEKLKKDKKKY